MFKWKKLGKIFDPSVLSNHPWIREYAQSPSAIVLNDRVRVYFSSRPAPDDNGQFKSYISYVDLNLNNLFDILQIAEQPILPLGKLGTFDEFGMNPVSVIKYKNEIRIYYAGWTRCESVPFNAAIGCAISQDNGQTFTRAGMGPVLSYAMDEPFVIGSPRIRRFNQEWYLWYSAGRKWQQENGRPEPVYKIRMASSADGINWHRHGKDLLSNMIEENECQASAEVIFLENTYHMFFSYRYHMEFKNKKKGYRIGYARSPNMLHWSRDDSKAGITISDTGWDSEMISYPNIFMLNKDIYMLYQGNEFGRFGFGLAQLERF